MFYNYHNHAQIYLFFLVGAVIIFTGILSVLILRRSLQWFRWLGMIFVIGGLVTVGLTDILYSDNGKNATYVIPPDPAYNTSLHQGQYIHKNFYDGHLILGDDATTLVGVEDEHTPTELLMGDVIIVCAQVLLSCLSTVTFI